MSYLYLDNLLGEDAVERWVGTIDLLEGPTGGRTSDELRAEIDRRSREPTEASWMLAQGADGLYVVNTAIKPIDHPYARYHLVVTVQRGIEQLSHSDELPALDEAGDELADALTAAGCAHLGRVTERRRRRIHFMCPDRDRASAIAGAWADRHRVYDPSVDVRDDPGWGSRKEFWVWPEPRRRF